MPKKSMWRKCSRRWELSKGETGFLRETLSVELNLTCVSKYWSVMSLFSVRFRSLPIAGTAVDEAGNINLVKKVCANTKKFSSAKDSQNAYGIVFSFVVLMHSYACLCVIYLYSGVCYS